MHGRALFTSLRYLPEDTPRQSGRGEAYGDLEKERPEPASESLDNAHQDEEDGKSVHMASTLQWQSELFPFGLIWKIERGQKLLNTRYQSCCYQPLGLNGAWSSERMGDFTEEAVQADMEAKTLESPLWPWDPAVRKAKAARN